MNFSLFSGWHTLEKFFLTWEHTQDIKYIPEVIYLETLNKNIAPLQNEAFLHMICHE